MESQRWLDPAGILQLAAVAAGFAICAVFITSLSSLGLLPEVVIAITAAAAGVLVQYSDWARFGGRRMIMMTNQWIRTRAIPAGVPDDVWRPLLLKREARAVRQWFLLVAAAAQIPLAVINLTHPRSMAEQLLWSCALLFWFAVSAWTIYYNLRWLPVIRQLLAHTRSRALTSDVRDDL
jgi:hypothetical protein